MSRLKDNYIKKIVPEMTKHFAYVNYLAVPKLDKVVLNIGLSASRADAKFHEQAAATLTRVSGQRPVFVKAKKSISSFKVRQGQVIGVMVTLRGERMYDFVDKLINLTLPNVRDFRGLRKKSIDRQGNLTIGFKEYLSFPEINPDEVENMHGLEVCLKTTATDRQHGFALLSLLGFPFVEKFTS